MEAAKHPVDDVLYVGALEIRPISGLVLTGDRTLNSIPLQGRGCSSLAQGAAPTPSLGARTS